MKPAMIAIGLLLVVGGIAGIVRPAKHYYDSHAVLPGEKGALHAREATDGYVVDPRVIGYGAAGLGVAVIVAALSLKRLSMPVPHGNPLPPSDC